jgi:hypothetical protein
MIENDPHDSDVLLHEDKKTLKVTTEEIKDCFVDIQDNIDDV